MRNEGGSLNEKYQIYLEEGNLHEGWEFKEINFFDQITGMHNLARQLLFLRVYGQLHRPTIGTKYHGRCGYDTQRRRAQLER